MLLRVAEQKLFVVRWSRRILHEVARNLIKERRATPEQAMKLADVMQRAFEDAEVPEAAIGSPEPVMLNEPADGMCSRRRPPRMRRRSSPRTSDTSRPSACERFGIEVVHPDAFLSELHEHAPAKIRVALTEQAAALVRPPLTGTEVLDRLAATVREFVSLVRHLIEPSCSRGPMKVIWKPDGEGAPTRRCIDAVSAE